jgi:hypothetical protein
MHSAITKRPRRDQIGLLIAALLVVTPLVMISAQGAGQFCVEAFEDRSGSGTRDPGEPALTGGISANLLDSEGVIAATALLDDSPFRAQGRICFEGLAAGQYTMVINSAEFTATTGDNLIVTLVEGAAPQILEYGGRRIAPAAAQTEAESETAFERDELIERTLIAGAGAAIAMLVTALIGMVLFAVFVRPRRRQPVYDPFYGRPPPSTGSGSMPPVRPTDTGEYRR